MKGKIKYTISQKFSCISMILMLLWLTVSAPFIVPDQQKKMNASKAGTAAQAELPADSNEDADTNPFANTTEEKPESGASTLSEYLHHIDELFLHSTVLTTSYNWHSSALYIAFHGELLSPPPEA
jgi:hypothetical protein